MNLQKSLIAFCCISLAMFTGCAEGSSSSAPAAANVNGVFEDAVMSGMPFSCGGMKGMTTSVGGFACPQGSTVTFTIGGITICTAPVQALMTPVSCAQATDPTANASTAAVVAVAQLLLSISTTPYASGTLTITAAELEAAANLSLDFSTATQADLLGAAQTITGNNALVLVSQATAESELAAVVGGAVAGNFSGTFSGSDTGTWSIMVAANGTVTGSGMNNTNGKNFNISGSLTSGTTYSGTSGTATWTGTMDTSKSPIVFSGTWMDGPDTGTFTGTKQ